MFQIITNKPLFSGAFILKSNGDVQEGYEVDCFVKKERTISKDLFNLHIGLHFISKY